jgi:hypothetical protein
MCGLPQIMRANARRSEKKAQGRGGGNAAIIYGQSTDTNKAARQLKVYVTGDCAVVFRNDEWSQRVPNIRHAVPQNGLIAELTRQKSEYCKLRRAPRLASDATYKPEMTWFYPPHFALSLKCHPSLERPRIMFLCYYPLSSPTSPIVSVTYV